MRDRKLYSPPERGSAAASSAYDNAPHSAATPPTTQSISTENAEWMSRTWKPRLVKTPMPIMSAMANAAAVVVVTVRNSTGRSSEEGAPIVPTTAMEDSRLRLCPDATLGEG